MANTKSIDLESSSSQYLSITDGDQTGLDLTEDLTFEMWVKLEAQPAEGVASYLITKRDDGSDLSYQFWYNESGGNYNFQMATYNTTGTDNNGYTWTNFPLTLATWTHIAVTIDTSTQTGLLYINGSSNATTSSSGSAAAIENSAAEFKIGARLSTPSNFWDGLMDEIGVWSRVLTPTEVTEIYNSGDGLLYDDYDAGLKTGNVAYWRLDNSLLDETANNNDLTNNSSATFSSDVPFVGAVGPANLKSINGLAKASIKSRNSLAIGSIKSINGLE